MDIMKQDLYATAVLIEATGISESVIEEHGRTLPELEPGAEVLGQAPDTARRLLVLGRQYHQAHDSAVVRLRHCTDAAEKADALAKLIETRGKLDFLKEWFWCECKHDLGCWDKPRVSIAKGWLVVLIEEPEAEGLTAAIAAGTLPSPKQMAAMLRRLFEIENE